MRWFTKASCWRIQRARVHCDCLKIVAYHQEQIHRARRRSLSTIERRENLLSCIWSCHPANVLRLVADETKACPPRESLASPARPLSAPAHAPFCLLPSLVVLQVALVPLLTSCHPQRLCLKDEGSTCTVHRLLFMRHPSVHKVAHVQEYKTRLYFASRCSILLFAKTEHTCCTYNVRYPCKILEKNRSE